MNRLGIINGSCSECGAEYTPEEIALYKQWRLNCKKCGALIFGERTITVITNEPEQQAAGSDEYLQLTFF